MFVPSSNWLANRNMIYLNGNIQNYVMQSTHHATLNYLRCVSNQRSYLAESFSWVTIFLFYAICRHVVMNSIAAWRSIMPGRQRIANEPPWTKMNGHRRVSWKRPADHRCVYNRNRKSIRLRIDTSVFRLCERTAILLKQMAQPTTTIVIQVRQIKQHDLSIGHN